jgi:HK97 family phage major capsid protein
LSGALSISNLANSVFASRLARGISRDLLTGNGVNKPTGLLTALANIGVSPVTAQGSSANDGSSATGANSLGSADFANAIAALDSAYLESPKCAFVMNRRTFAAVASLTDKMGQLLRLVQYAGKKPYIYGVPVKISPSVDDIGISNTPVILGDFNFWCTRLVTADDVDGIGLYTYKESDSLIESGNVGLSCFSRAGGALLYSDTGSPAPFITIRNHS